MRRLLLLLFIILIVLSSVSYADGDENPYDPGTEDWYKWEQDHKDDKGEGGTGGAGGSGSGEGGQPAGRTVDTTGNRGYKQTCGGDWYGEPGSYDEDGQGNFRTDTGRQARGLPIPDGYESDDKKCTKKICEPPYVCDATQGSECNGKCRKFRTGDPERLPPPAPPGTVIVGEKIYADKGTHCIGDSGGEIQPFKDRDKPFNGKYIDCGKLICRPGLQCQTTSNKRCVCVGDETETSKKVSEISVESISETTQSPFQRFINGFLSLFKADRSVADADAASYDSFQEPNTPETPTFLQKDNSAFSAQQKSALRQSVPNLYEQTSSQSQTAPAMSVPAEVEQYTITFRDENGAEVVLNQYFDTETGELAWMETKALPAPPDEVYSGVSAEAYYGKSADSVGSEVIDSQGKIIEYPLTEATDAPASLTTSTTSAGISPPTASVSTAASADSSSGTASLAANQRPIAIQTMDAKNIIRAQDTTSSVVSQGSNQISSSGTTQTTSAGGSRTNSFSANSLNRLTGAGVVSGAAFADITPQDSSMILGLILLFGCLVVYGFVRKR